jgi:HEAT repeat protein
MQTFVRAFVTTTVLSAATALFAQQPTIVHGQVTTEAADHELNAALDGLKRQNSTMWVGYSIPVVSKFSSGWNSSRIAYLEGNGDSANDSDGNSQSSDRAVILLRIADGSLMKLRVESPERELDAGGLRFVWLNGVNPDDSVRVLTDFARQGDARHLRDSAVFAISVHQTNAATAALLSLASAGNDLALREKAAFWLASQRGHDGFAAIQRLAHEDSDPKFREKLAFDLTLSKDPEALNELIRMAHEDAAPQVRKQAQFWMATKGGKRVTEDLRTLATNDPNDQIRKSAVFALSRLPGDEAATQLIAVADSSKDPVVRRQAIFWLGQSSDPRALEYLTKLLKQ